MATYIKRGFTPENRNTGGANANTLRTFPIQNSYGSNIFYGDPVGSSAGFLVRTTGPKVIGVFQGCMYVDSTLKRQVNSLYFPTGTSTAGRVEGGYTTPMALVAPAGDGCVFTGVADAAVTTSIIGKLYGVSLGSGSTVTGQSTAVVQVSASFAEASVTQATVRIIGVVNTPDNLYSDTTPVVEIIFPNVGYDS